jgi:hypothetical protein
VRIIGATSIMSMEHGTWNMGMEHGHGTWAWAWGMGMDMAQGIWNTDSNVGAMRAGRHKER